MRMCDVKNIFIARIFMVYLILKPFYVFNSGMPQPSDVFLITCFGILLFSRKKETIAYTISNRNWRVVRLFGLLFLHQVVVNFLWFLYVDSNRDPSNSMFIMSNLYTLFNLISVILCMFIYERVGTQIYIQFANGLAISSFVVFFLIFFSSNDRIRMIGGFNNPNQLGYYALILFTGLVIFANKIKSPYGIISIAITIYAIIVSMSKAALLGLFFLVIMILMFGNKVEKYGIAIKLNFTIKLVLIILISLAVYILCVDTNIFITNSYLAMFRERINNTWTEGDSNLGDGRGYNRIFEMGINILWGMGEGGYNRFVALTGMEIHSSYMSILVSYGLIGTFIYGLILSELLFRSKAKIVSLCLFSGVILYWITHQGLRSTLLWILTTSFMLTQQYNQKVRI